MASWSGWDTYREPEPEQPQFVAPPITRTDNPPPFPPFMPAVSPVADLKNRTAQSNQYTEDAQRKLNRMPTTLNYGVDNRHPFALGTYSYNAYEDGTESPSSIRIENTPGENERTLAHEFAHAWEHKYMSPMQRNAWQANAPDLATDYARLRVSRDYQDPDLTLEKELYGTGTEQGPWNIPPDVRNDYYPMYRQDIQAPRPPGLQMGSTVRMSPSDEWKQLQADWFRFRDSQPQQKPLYSDNGDAFDATNWVNEYEAPLGYYEDGGAVRSPLPYPRQWDDPQFPSMKQYAEWNPLYSYGMTGG